MVIGNPSACYAFNDLRDAQADRLHPRKRRRPIAAGLVSPAAAVRLAVVMLALSALCVALAMLPRWLDVAGLSAPSGQTVLGLGVLVGLYVLNTTAYSIWFKHHAVLDVMSLSLGFVLRVLGGCAAAGVTPSPWLLNVTFFLSMFLAFGKRLGERRTMGSAEAAGAARPVQQAYTDELLRMTVVVTAVAALLTYAGYVQSQVIARGLDGIDVLWFTVLPATYGLLRSIVLLERGLYDDPTELAARDRHCQMAAVIFVVLTAASFAQRAG
ncbi:UbiA prenyltransferase family protein [Leptolyngbya sp. 15MV]|nr:UbiA prenyltransferase family protein [Leptolyngbya sp. 15MV]